MLNSIHSVYFNQHEQTIGKNLEAFRGLLTVANALAFSFEIYYWSIHCHPQSGSAGASSEAYFLENRILGAS